MSIEDKIFPSKPRDRRRAISARSISNSLSRHPNSDESHERRALTFYVPTHPSHQAGAKKSFGEWLLDKACRDSSVIGAGYEDDLKSGKYKKGGKK